MPSFHSGSHEGSNVRFDPSSGLMPVGLTAENVRQYQPTPVQTLYDRIGFGETTEHFITIKVGDAALVGFQLGKSSWSLPAGRTISEIYAISGPAGFAAEVADDQGKIHAVPDHEILHEQQVASLPESIYGGASKLLERMQLDLRA